MAKGTVLCSDKQANALQNNYAIRKMTKRTKAKRKKLFFQD